MSPVPQPPAIRSRYRRTSLMIPGALTAGVLALTACGPADTSSGSGEGENSYTIAIPQDMQGVDRATYSSEASKVIGDIMHSRLLEVQTSEPGQECAVDVPPVIKDDSPLVEEWSVTEDGTGIDFTLRDDVLSAAGNTLTSADVEWSIERIKAVDASAQTLWFSVGGFDPEDTITVHSPTEFTLHLTEPNGLAPYALSGNAGLILDSETVQEHSTDEDPWATEYLTDHTADFGPWTLSEFGSQQLTFEPNPHYSGDRGNLDQVVVRTVSDPSSRIQMLQTGVVSEAIGLDFTQMEALRDAEGVNVGECPNPARDWLGLNTKDPILGDTKVRQAISLALDREAIETGVYRGFAAPAVGGLAQAYGADMDDTNYRQDLDRARELLAEAGHEDGFSFELSISNAQPGPYAEALAVLIQQQLKEVDIDVKITNVPSATQYRSDGLDHKMQAFLMAETPAFGNAGYSAWLTAGCDGLQNYMAYCNEDLDALTETLIDGTAGDREQDLLDEIADLIAEEQPAIYLVDRPNYNLRHECAEHVPSSGFGHDMTEAETDCG